MIDSSEKRNRQLAFELQNSHVCEKGSKGLVKKYRGGGPEQRGGGSSGFEPCARGGSCNFQLPLGGGSPYFIT